MVAKDLSLPLLGFIDLIHAVTLNEISEDESIIEVKSCIAQLLSTSDWLPDWALTLTHENKERDAIIATDVINGPMITLVSWNQGQVGRIHDHRTWGALGVIKGCECCVSYDCLGKKGDVFEDCLVSNRISLTAGDVFGMPQTLIHNMLNEAADNCMSLSIHVYGKDLRYTHRSIYDIDQKRCLPNPNTEFLDLTQ